MKRRTFVLGLGATVAGGGAVVGSGAFSSVEAERTVTVETANDNNAYLRLTEPKEASDEPTNDRSSQRNGQLRFQFPGLLEGRFDDPNPENPDGLGEDTVYRFARETSGDPLFRAQNQGSKPIELYGSQADPEDAPAVRMFDIESGDLLTEANRSEPIDAGELVDLGLEIDTHGVEVDAYNDLTLTVFAEAADT